MFKSSSLPKPGSRQSSIGGQTRKQQLLDLARYRSYGVHYTDPRTTPASEHHVEFCLSIERRRSVLTARHRGKEHSDQPLRARP